MLIEIPSTHIAGDALAFASDLPEHPAGELTFSIKNHLNVISLTADVNRLVAVDSATTADWVPGKYQWFAFITVDGARTTIAKGDIEILPDPTGNFDPRSHAEKMVTLLEQALEETVGTEISVTIDGQSSTWDRKEALILRNQYKAEVNRQKRGRTKKIYMRFPE